MASVWVVGLGYQSLGHSGLQLIRRYLLLLKLLLGSTPMLVHPSICHTYLVT
uniref:Uncharacterized protein n=1 Tax=Rhizophora mucronata TaxID=61149 RepID=A0A2P2JWS4_RHIMU